MFADLGLRGPVLHGVYAAGYRQPTPIQEQAIPLVLQGRDVVGCAQTGTGKTAAFLLPILQTLAAESPCGGPRALVVTPTRELAAQIQAAAVTLAGKTGQRALAVYGGVAYQTQARRVRAGVDLLIATPGRLLDMLRRGDVALGHIGTLVLDEADRMLDMGFWPDIKRISEAVPPHRQSLFFSATMTGDVLTVIEDTLRDPVFVEVKGSGSPAANVAQSVLPVAGADKLDQLVDYLHRHEPQCTLVFARTRRRADRLARSLSHAGIACAAIHGDRSQAQRERTLHGFRQGAIRLLVATDIVARGIDVDGITHVINFDMPVCAEDYVHRIGRTARAGSSGEAVTLCTDDDKPALRAIERHIGVRLAGGTRDTLSKGELGGRDRRPTKRYTGRIPRRRAVVGALRRQGVDMAKGTVKWFNAQKGYGFIAREGEKDVFVHSNDLASGVSRLDESQNVEFEVQQGQKGPQAVNVRLA